MPYRMRSLPQGVLPLVEAPPSSPLSSAPTGTKGVTVTAVGLVALVTLTPPTSVLPVASIALCRLALLLRLLESKLPAKAEFKVLLVGTTTSKFTSTFC